jgi:hypothetical protein
LPSVNSLAEMATGEKTMTDAPASEPAPKLTVSQFVQTLKGTEHEVWTRLLLGRHRFAVMTASAWHAVLREIGVEPAHPHDSRYDG